MQRKLYRENKTPKNKKQKQLHQQLGEFADWMKQDKNLRKFGKTNGNQFR